MDTLPGDPKEADTILIVDDDEEIRHGLERSLRRLGYEVLVATNGAEGLALALEQKPKVVVTDIRMPEMDGHTLIRRLAAHDIDSSVVVMSSHGQMEDVVDVMRNGAVDYLKKPWTPSELVAAIGRAVEIYEKRHRSRKLLERAEAALTSPTGAPDLAPSAAPKSPLASILERLRTGEILIPAVPAVVSELRTLLRRPDTRVGDLVTLIERDPRLAIQLLRISNTAQYARMGKNSDLKMAVNRVGLRQVESLVETILVHGCYQASDPKIRLLQSKIWRYSLARALSMRALAELSMMGRSIDPETAYVAGLLSDLGASFLLWLIAERSPAGDPEASVAFLQQHHEEIGGIALTHWGADPTVILMARTHHATAPPAPPNLYWSLQVLGQSLADRIAPGEEITSRERSVHALVDRCSAEVRIGATTMTKVYEQLRTEFGGILAALS